MRSHSGGTDHATSRRRSDGVNVAVAVAVAAAMLGANGCTARTVPSGATVVDAVWPWPMPSALTAAVADTVTTSVIAPGVRLHQIVRNTGPIRASVLDIDLASCVSLTALKSGVSAVGRATTSALLGAIAPEDAPIAAVNADFFLFTPPGVPVGALVRNGELIAGPINRPVLAFDHNRRPFIGRLLATGTVTANGMSVAVTTWNRPSASAIGIVDRAWGQPLDSVVRPTARMLVPLGNKRYRVVALPTTHSGQTAGDTLMLVGSSTQSPSPSQRFALGATVSVTMGITPIAPRTAVGGFPMLLRDSVIDPVVDSAGAASFRGLNPRTAAGIAANGRRLLLVVIDGRQPSHSMGTTTRATAELLRDLGARDAVNLDGGGSSTMVIRDATLGVLRVVNKPSDAAGERPVGNGIAVLGRCQ